MRILIDMLHPAHVHFFRNFRCEMESRGHEIAVTSRVKEMTTRLLKLHDIPHTILSRQASGKLRLGWEFLARTARLMRFAHRFEPDVLTGVMGPSIAVAGRILRRRTIVFYDTEDARQTNRFVYPLAHAVCTPESYEVRVRGRHITYPGFQELAYLHPARFTPDPSALKDFGLSPNDPYFLVRFVSWEAVHDTGQKGLSLEMKTQVIRALERRGKVVVSSEHPLPSHLEDRALRGPIHRIHHVLAHANGVVGESPTMCCEAAVLGVPSIHISSRRLGYLQEQERKYGLVRNLSPAQPQKVLHSIHELPWEGVEAGHRRLLNEKIDVTAWMVDLFEELA